MTDKERQKLCAALRTQITESWFYLDSEDACHGIVRPMGNVAADEIERLMKRVDYLERVIHHYLRNDFDAYPLPLREGAEND